MKPIQYILLVSFFLLLLSMHLVNSSDMNQDLGRHIKIGEIIVSEKSIPDTNLFSYTNPDFPFVNHHWLSEVIFYVSSSVFGPTSLIVIKILCIILAIGIIIALGYRLGIPLTMTVTAILFSPLFLERSNIRPEIFGYLLFSLILYIVFQYPANRKLLYGLPVIMVLWVNLHISFIFGFIPIGLLFFKICWSIFKDKKSVKADCYILILSVGAALINPNGVYGLLYPLNIFKNYGYTIVENQNIFFLNSIMLNPQIKYLFFLSPLILASAVVLLMKHKILEAVLLALFTGAQVAQIRHMPFFALAATPAAAAAIHLMVKKIRFKKRQAILLSVFLSVICIGFSVLFANNVFSNTFDLQKSAGIAMTEDAKPAAEFLLKNRLSNPIFNNFDIGGYAIYKLYPIYKVFVDNRPEAYPKEFLEGVYIKLQTSPELRKQIFKKYDIQTVFFAHTDQTYWGEAFMRDILADQNWRLVFLDENMIILTADDRFDDIRENKAILANLLEKNNDYIAMLKLSRIFNFIGRNDLANLAFSKAESINPVSCGINKQTIYRLADSPQFQKAAALKNKYWYCF